MVRNKYFVLEHYKNHYLKILVNSSNLKPLVSNTFNFSYIDLSKHDSLTFNSYDIYSFICYIFTKVKQNSQLS